MALGGLDCARDRGFALLVLVYADAKVKLVGAGIGRIKRDKLDDLIGRLGFEMFEHCSILGRQG